MTKKILTTAIALCSITSVLFAQENDTEKNTKKKVKVEKRVYVNGKKIDVDKANINPSDIKKIKLNKNGEHFEIDVAADEQDSNKVKVFINGDEVKQDGKKENKRMTIIVEGDNVTMNGKEVDGLDDIQMEMFGNDAGKLKALAPMIKKIIKERGMNDMNGSFSFNDDEFGEELPMNKAMLGVVTEKDEKGAMITTVTKESGAEKAGLKINDIITKVNDDKIENSSDLIKAIGKYKPEDKVKITYLRDGKEATTKAVLGKNESPKTMIYNFSGDRNFKAPSFGQFDFGGKEMHFGKTRPKIGFKVQDVEEGGFKILEVEPETPAAKAGLQVGDIVTQYEDVKLKDIKDFDSRTAMHKPGNSIKITYTRNGASNTTEIKFTKKLVTADL